MLKTYNTIVKYNNKICLNRKTRIHTIKLNHKKKQKTNKKTQQNTTTNKQTNKQKRFEGVINQKPLNQRIDTTREGNKDKQSTTKD